MFSVYLQVLSKYWHCLEIWGQTEVPMQKAAESLAHTKGTVKGHRQSCLYGFAYCLWKCHLVSCPYIRRNSSNPEALCLPWLRRELASGLRNKGRDPETAVCFFSCQAGAGWNQARPTPALTMTMAYFLSRSLLNWLETGFTSSKGLVQGHSWLPQV